MFTVPSSELSEAKIIVAGKAQTPHIVVFFGFIARAPPAHPATHFVD
jgi:hypothetical protein